MTEFLSLCDVLFNVVSLAGYFCDVVFDVVLSYALFERGHFFFMAFVIALVMVSLIISQILSLRWYMQKMEMKSRDLVPSNGVHGDNGDQKKSMDITNNSSSTESSDQTLQSKIERHCVIALHCCQLGVLWRYAKLFVPVNLRHVKHEVRDLCMLRLVHAFCEAAPMLLLQLYILVTIQKEEANLLKPEIPLQSLGSGHVAPVIVQQPSDSHQHQLQTFKDLNIVSCTLSLFSVCWALASFSKNVRIQNVHRLVLTWLGVIFQFLWRLGTVISRVASLTVYASVYKQWVILVIALHWISMFLWLISPKNVFHGERITRLRKITLAGLIAFVYVFAYINLQEVNHRQKMFIFYFVMFLENSLLVFLWLIGIWIDKPENWYMTPIWIFASFLAGLLFMFLYYRYFHVRRLGYEAGGRLPSDIHTKYSCADGTSCISFDDNLNTCQKYPSQIPGVFNCRFSNPVGNGAARRKKKKPTTFVPPPNLNMDPSLSNGLENQISNTGLMSIPFWRRPVARSHTYGSENEGSAGSRVDIYQKLQEKKQKQLAELKIIEEEIKQGKLGGPVGNIKLHTDDSRASLPRQPIPHVKKHINIDPHEWRTSSPELCIGASMGSILNDLNVMPSPNINEINNLNKYTRNYDPLYNNFVLDTTNMPALNKKNFIAMENNQRNMRNMSPISSQISGTDQNHRQIVPRSKIPHNAPRNPFAEPYRSNFPNVFAESFNNTNELHQVTQSPTRMVSTSNSNNDDSNDSNKKINVGETENCAKHKQQQQQQQQQQRMHLQRQMQRAKTPEILLAPHYLDNSSAFYDWMDREQQLPYRTESKQHQCHIANENLDDPNENVLDQNEYRIPSDIDSQVSLPRSYTLPREFKYYRRNKGRKFIKNERFIMSTNSSDGDVDSAEDNESGRCSNISGGSQQQQHCHRLQSPTVGKNSPLQTAPLNQVSNARNQFPISISATTSPVTVTNIHSGPSNPLMNNLNLTNDASNANTGNCTRSASASPNIALNVPNYFNRIPNGHYLQQAGRNRMNLNGSPSIDCNMMSGTFDLISGVENTGAIAAAMNRRMRLRGYGNQKNGMVRHETKL